MILEGKTGMVISVHLPFVWWKPSRYISLAIQKFTKSKWGHTAALINVWGGWYVIEMNPSPQIVSFDKYKEGKELKISQSVFSFDAKQWSLVMFEKQNDTVTK